MQMNKHTNPSNTNLSQKPLPPQPSCRSAEWSGTHHAGDPRWKELHTTGTSSAPRNTVPWSPPHSPSPPPSSLRPTKNHYPCNSRPLFPRSTLGIHTAHSHGSRAPRRTASALLPGSALLPPDPNTSLQTLAPPHHRMLAAAAAAVTE